MRLGSSSVFPRVLGQKEGLVHLRSLRRQSVLGHQIVWSVDFCISVCSPELTGQKESPRGSKLCCEIPLETRVR